MRPPRSLTALLISLVCCLLIALNRSSFFVIPTHARENYDVVLLNGTVIDPESKLDAVRNVGISRGRIEVIDGKLQTGIYPGRPVRAPF
ncbi:MAG: hypothetical protein ND895_21865 [Pyrinomonadaceae bacterium]|nr:hypothetical protein [Pyrinomonadaceae bacterium]